MDRFARNLGHEKQGRIKSVLRRPEYFEGKDGDMQIYNGRLYIKDKSTWYQFLSKSEFEIAKILPGDNDESAQLELKYDGTTAAVQDIRTLAEKINKIIELLQLDIK